MKIFIFNNVSKLTNNWHDSGGLMVIANTLERAIELSKLESPSIKLSEEEIQEVIVHELKEEAEEKIFIFPDAGCC